MPRRDVFRGTGWFIVSVTLLSSSACIDAARVNSTCAWSDAIDGHLDLTSSSDVTHLRQDAQIAWELAVRYGDALEGVVSSEARPRQRMCRLALEDTIIARHGVTKADVREAAMWRVWWIDIVVVFIPMMLLALFVTRFAARFMRIIPVTFPRALLLAMPAALIMAGLTQYWGMGVETLRLRNWHLSDRVSAVPTTHHGVLSVGVLFVICVFAVSSAAASRILPSTGPRKSPHLPSVRE